MKKTKKVMINCKDNIINCKDSVINCENSTINCKDSDMQILVQKLQKKEEEEEPSLFPAIKGFVIAYLVLGICLNLNLAYSRSEWHLVDVGVCIAFIKFVCAKTHKMWQVGLSFAVYVIILIMLGMTIH